MFSGIQFEWEMFILYGTFIFIFVIIAWIAVVTCTRIEVWLDRSKSILFSIANYMITAVSAQKYPPWDWSRTRDKYWKLGTIA